MKTVLEEFLVDFQYLVNQVAKVTPMRQPVAFDADDFATPMLEQSRRGNFFPIGDVFIRDWDRTWTKTWPGVNFGGRMYTIDGVTFARVYVAFAIDRPHESYNFFLVDQADYAKLYRAAIRCKRNQGGTAIAPVMHDDQRESLWRNTVGFLEPTNLKRIQQYGGRPKRGLLLTGPPGNGKTSACRWIKAEVEKRGWEAKTVSPDDYQAARGSGNAAEAVRELFRAGGRGVVFFDDMDIALRDRESVKETDDQAVFLSAMDGIQENEGVVYVFTTNCAMELIDPAFRRPGRIDLTLHFPKPDIQLRSMLMQRWHQEMRSVLREDRLLRDTEGFSFAEIEELKNLLVLHYIDSNEWDWEWAKEQFEENRSGLSNRRKDRPVGFVTAVNPPSNSSEPL